MAEFKTIRETSLFKIADRKSASLGTLQEGTLFNGDLDGAYIKTHIDAVSPEEGYVFGLHAAEVLSAPEPIAQDEHSEFCDLVTTWARKIRIDRDYLMAVAYCGTKNLEDLGGPGDGKVGPFQFTAAEWHAAI